MLKYKSINISRGGLMIIKKGIILFITLLMLAFTGQVIAQPMAFGPQEIIDKSELIVVGTITKNLTGSNERSVTLEVDGVLKGSYNKNKLTLTMTKPADGKWLDFNFPAEGKQVFLPLIMNSSTDYGFLSDLFNVGLIKSGKVKLFNPNNISSEALADYELVYTDYVKSNFKFEKAEEEADKAAVSETKEEPAVENTTADDTAEDKVNSTPVSNVTEEKKVEEENKVFKAEKIVKNQEVKKSAFKPKVRESLTIAIWLVIVFYSLSLVNVGRKDV